MAKPKSNRLGMYADVRQVLDAALTSGGGSFELEDHGKAVHWRQRCYRFRKLFAETIGLDKMSPYDKLTFPRIPDNSSTVLIRLIGENMKGTFTPNSTTVAEEEFEDDIDTMAIELAKKIEKGELG